MSTCAVCIEKFTNQPHKKQAICPYCPIEACVKCTQTYLLGTHDDPHCMGCRKSWTREVMDTILLTTWINGEYKLHRQNILLDRERSKLPAAQLIVERRKLADVYVESRNGISAEIQLMEAELIKKRNEYYRLSRIIDIYNRGNDPFANGHDNEVKEERRAFIMPCTATGCRGFLSQAYKCGVCDNYTCPDCHELKGPTKDDATHTCDPNTVANVRCMKKDCKACPECGTNIFKIEGCFGKDTPILMWDGSTKLSQTIQIGDELVGDDGKKRIVQHTFNDTDTLYEIKQNKGASYTVNGKHTLVLKYSGELCTIFPSNEIEITVEEYMKLYSHQKLQLFGYKSNECNEWAITKGIILPNKDYYRTSIEVVEKEVGQYYGWIVDGNNRFLHEDFTVLRNCSQMFCTNCNTPFDWTTGRKIVHGAIHNPHYFEYLRATNGGAMPRNPGDIPCIANLPNAWQFDRELIRRFMGIPSELTGFLYNSLNTITHIQHVEIANQTNHAQDMDNTEANVKYLKQDYTEVRWKQVLQQREKRRIKRDEVRMRYEAFVGACVDIYGRIMSHARKYEKIGKTEISNLTAVCEEARTYLLTLRTIFNEGMMELSKRYKCQVLQLHEKNLKREMKTYEAGRLRRAKKTDSSTVGSNDNVWEDEPEPVPEVFQSGNVLVPITR